VRWHVRYRLGGREAPEVHDSVWPTKGDAQARVAVIRRAWAEGRPVPPILPDALEAGPTLAEVLDDYAAARRDVGSARQRTFRQTRALLGTLAALEPAAVTPAHVRGWVGELAATRSRKTVEIHLGVLRQVLDHAEISPNPARHGSVRLPRGERDEVRVPTGPEWRAMLGTLAPRHRLAARVLEGTGLRVGELRALTWGEVDLRHLRVRVAGGKTKAARRWVPLEPALADALAASCPQEDRAGDRPVIRGFSEQTLRGAMARACRDAGLAHYSPHDLRHRYISLLVHAGASIPVVQAVVGHARGSVTLDVYAHVLVDEPAARLASLLDGAIRVASRIGAAPVRPGDAGPVTDPDKTPATSTLPGEVEDSGLEAREASWHPGFRSQSG